MRSNKTGIPKMPDGLASGLIERSVPADSAITAMVVFPKPESALVPTPLGHFRSVALMQIADATLWMLQMPGKGWSPRRLKVAADTLSGFPGEPPNRRSVEGALRRDLGVEAVALLDPAISTMEASQWGTGEIAHALFGRDAPTRRNSLIADPGIETQIRAVEASLVTELTAALEDFVERLDPTARKCRRQTAGSMLRCTTISLKNRFENTGSNSPRSFQAYCMQQSRRTLGAWEQRFGRSLTKVLR